MKTVRKVIYVLAVVGGFSATNLFGQFDYVENSPVSSGANDAASDTFASGGQLSDDELATQFGPAAASSGATAKTGEQGAAGSQQAGAEVGGGTFQFGGQKAELYTVKIPYSRKLSERATLELSVPFTYSIYDKALFGLKSAKAYGGGINAGYAWQAFLKKDNVPYRWKITPSTGLYYRDSSDFREGAWVFNAGLSSSFAWQFAPGWVVNVGNSISFARNNGIKNYPDPVRDNQQTLKNGIQLYRMLDRWTLYVYFVETAALNDAFVDSYETYGVGAGYKLTKTRSVKATVLTEEGNGRYQSVRATIGTNWQF